MIKSTTKLVMQLLMLLFAIFIQAQDCNSLYLVNAQNGNVYNISALTGTLPAVTTTLSTTGRSNLAVGANPLNTTQTVFTSSNTTAGSTVNVSNSSIGTTMPLSVGGLTANPNSASATYGYVYGMSSTKHLVKASPAPAADLGLVTGDADWTAGTVSSDSFFDSSGRMYVVITSGGSTRSIYRIDVTTLQATRYLGLSGSLPFAFQGVAFYNNKIYFIEGTQFSILLVSWFGANVYEVNPNTGVSALKTSYNLSTLLGPFSGADDLDLASCQSFTPTTAPTCNELLGIVSETAPNSTFVYKIDLTTLATTQVASNSTVSYGNLAFGPLPTDLSKNRFVASTAGASSTMYAGTANTATTALVTTGNTIASPIGLGTDPSTGYVYGINAKVLTRWTGTGNGTSLGTVTGDTNWTNGITLNDVAVDNGGNLYCINSSTSGADVWLYRINPTTLTATMVVKFTGVYPTTFTSSTTTGNGLAYLGEHFYYSLRSTGSGTTTMWRVNAMTSVSELVGTITGTPSAGAFRSFTDLASCATVTNVPAGFTFNCGGAALTGPKLLPNGTTQYNTIRIPITGAVNGMANFTISGIGISTSPTPYTAFVAQGATYVDIPIIYDGSSPSGNRAITVTSPQATGSCSFNIFIEVDSDGDGTPDSIDLDDDNDGILDTTECNSSERVVLGNFVVATAGSVPSISAWNTVGINGTTTIYQSPTGLQFNANYTNQSIAQNLTGVFNTTSSTGPIINLNGFRGTDGRNGTNTTTSSEGFTTTVSYAGVNYLTLTTITGTSPNMVVTPLNGASIVDGTTTVAMGTYKNLGLQLPYGVATSGELKVFFDILSSNNIEGTNQVADGDDLELASISLNSCKDTDGDGIVDFLDLDSDNDGCTDAFEGGAIITASQLTTASGAIASQSPNLNFGTAVDTNGIPTTIGASGQTAGQSLDGGKNDCLDSDADGVPNWQDLDDDNDGILDVSENGACTATSTLSTTGWKATVYDAPSTTDAWGEISAANTFPTPSYYPIATFDYNQFANTSDAFDIDFATGVTGLKPSNPKVTNYVGGTIDGNASGTPPNTQDDYAILFQKTITTAEEGTYAFDFIYGDDQLFIYKNGVEVYQRLQAYNPPFNVNDVATITVVEGDVISMVAAEENLYNTEIRFNARKTAGSCTLTDTDGDGIPNYLDLDSDNDGCSDAIEGGAAFTTTNLVNSSMPGGNSGATNGTYNLPVVQNLGNTVGNTATTLGVPTVAGTGQTVGDSQNAAANTQCLVTSCYKPGILDAANTYPTKHGITALGRAGADNENWPMVRQSAWSVLEAKTKGFVVNRVAFSDADSNPATPEVPTGITVANFVEGMMVYDTTNNCLKVYTSIDGTNFAWHCMGTQTCPQ